MKRIFLISIVLCSICMTTGCTLKNYTFDSKSNKISKVKISGDKADLTINVISKTSPTETKSAAIPLIAISVAKEVINLGKEWVKYEIDKNAKSYSGEYKCSTSKTEFLTYNSSSSNFTINLPELTIKREILLDGKPKNACTLILEPELSSDNSAFRYKVKSIDLIYSIAKIKKKYTYLNIDVEVSLKSLVSSAGKTEIKDLRTTVFQIPLVTFGNTNPTNIYSGWIPLPSPSESDKKKPIDSKEVKIIEDKDDVTGTTKKNTITTTLSKEQILPADKSGDYEVAVKIIETNPFKVKAESRKEGITKLVDTGSEGIKSILDAATKKEDKE